MASAQATFKTTILPDQNVEPSDEQDCQQWPNDAKEPDIDFFIGDPQDSGGSK